MFAITIESVFSAAHALTVAGVREPVHGHDWHVTATFEGPELDSDGLLVDFHTLESTLRQITDPFNNSNLNDHVAFESLNPSAEHVARYIADQLSEAVGDALAEHGRLASVTISEAPRCTATYRPA